MAWPDTTGQETTTSGPRTLPRQELTGSREKRKAPDFLQTETSLTFLLPLGTCKPVPLLTRPVSVCKMAVLYNNHL